MSLTPTLIQCPDCAISLKFDASSAATRVRCPKCGCEIHVVKDNDTVETMDFDNLPPPLIVSEPVLPPRRRFWRSLQRSITSTLAAKRQTLNHIILACVLLATTVAIGAGIYSSKDKLPLESMEVLLPGHDSPVEVLEQYVDTTDAITKQLNGISDVDSRDRTIPLLRRLIGSCRALMARAAALGPLPDQEFQSFNEWFENRLPAQTQLVSDSAKKVHAQRRLGSTKLHAVLFDLTTITNQFGPVIETAWGAIPQPNTEAQRSARRIVMVQYRVWCAAVSVSNQEENRELEAMIASAASDMESILVKHVAEGRDQMELDRSPYAELSDHLVDDLQLRVDALQSEFGDPDDATAFQRYLDAAVAFRKL